MSKLAEVIELDGDATVPNHFNWSEAVRQACAYLAFLRSLFSSSSPYLLIDH
jgi:hypothetical protein